MNLISPELERKLLIGGIILVSLILLSQVLFSLVLAPRLTIETIELNSDLTISDQQFMEMSGLQGNLNYFSLQERKIEEKLLAIPQIRQAEVRRQFPNGLKVMIRRREAVALIWKQDLEGQGVFAVDRDGILYGNTRGVNQWDLPVISGLSLEGLNEGDRLDESLQLLLQDLEDLKLRQPAYYRILSEVKLLPGMGEGYTMLVYLTTHHIAAHCSLPLNKEILEKAILVLDVLEDEGMAGEVEEVDIQPDNIRYRRREV